MTVLSYYCLSFSASYTYASPKSFYYFFYYDHVFNISVSLRYKLQLKYQTMPYSRLAYIVLFTIPFPSVHLNHFLYSSSFYEALWFLYLYLPTDLRQWMLIVLSYL